MKKQQFILLEVMIACSLFVLCVCPRVIDVLYIQKKNIDRLFILELEREANDVYYNVLLQQWSLSDINTHSSQKIEYGPVSLSIEGGFSRGYNVYYYLYHRAPKTHDDLCYNIHLKVCFEPILPSKSISSSSSYEYKFNFLGKVVDKNF